MTGYSSYFFFDCLLWESLVSKLKMNINLYIIRFSVTIMQKNPNLRSATHFIYKLETCDIRTDGQTEKKVTNWV